MSGVDIETQHLGFRMKS